MTSEGFTILELSRFRVTDGNIRWVVGKKGKAKKQGKARKEQDRQGITEGGMKREGKTKTFFKPENH